MARDVHSSVVKVMDGNSSFTYYLVKLNGGLVHQHLGNLGHDYIQAEENGNDGGNDQVWDAEHPELAPAVELWRGCLLYIVVLLKLVRMVFLIVIADIECHLILFYRLENTRDD